MSETQKLLLNVVALLVIGVVVARLTIVDLVVVETNTMAPTLTYGEQVLIWTHSTPEFGDIVVCEHPVEPGRPVWGRVLATPGHTIRSGERGSLWVDDNQALTSIHGPFKFYDVLQDKRLDMRLGAMSYHDRHDHEFISRPNQPLAIRPTTVKGGIYLLGDNRTDWHGDSRRFGEVDPASCLGTVFLRWKAAPNYDDDIAHSRFSLVR